MKTAIAPQTVAGTQPTYWVKTRLRSWASFLCAGRPQWHQDKGTVKHRQSPQVGYVPHAPESTFSMLVESDILGGRRSICP